jgi:hypothetical protein
MDDEPVAGLSVPIKYSSGFNKPGIRAGLFFIIGHLAKLKRDAGKKNHFSITGSHRDYLCPGFRKPACWQIA